MDHSTLFPREVTGDVPRVTLTGDDQVHVEQHKGLIAYQPEEVVFRVAGGKLTVQGQDLRFRLYTSMEAMLMGQVSSIAITCRKGEPSA